LVDVAQALEGGRVYNGLLILIDVDKIVDWVSNLLNVLFHLARVRVEIMLEIGSRSSG